MARLLEVDLATFVADPQLREDGGRGGRHMACSPDPPMEPIFYDGRLVGFAGSTAHAPDIGGKIRSPEPREVFEEGFQIPIMRISTPFTVIILAGAMPESSGGEYAHFPPGHGCPLLPNAPLARMPPSDAIAGTAQDAGHPPPAGARRSRRRGPAR